MTQLGSNFYKKLVDICSEVGMNPEDLLCVMISESGMNPAAHEKTYGASGLIQFMPSTLKSMGYKGDPADFRKISGEGQLDYVRAYIKSQMPLNGGPFKSAAQYYVANFYPVALKLPGVKALDLSAPIVEEHPATVKDKNGQAWSKKYFDVGVKIYPGSETMAYKANPLFHGKTPGAITYGDMVRQTDRNKQSSIYIKALQQMKSDTGYVPQTKQIIQSRHTKKYIRQKSHDNLFSILDKYLKQVFAEINVEENIKLGFIRKLPNGKYRVLSEKGKNLGTFDSKSKAKKRLQQVEYFKHNSADDGRSIIDLTEADSFTYSAILRKLRQQTSKEIVKEFLEIFKVNFDKCVKKKLKDPEKISLQDSLIKFNKLHKIKLSKELIKNAATENLGDAESVGKYLSNIVKFTFSKISDQNKNKYINSLKNKLLNMNSNEISSKEMPESASIGHAISFIKYVLFNQDSNYIKEVLQNLVKNL